MINQKKPYRKLAWTHTLIDYNNFYLDVSSDCKESIILSSYLSITLWMKQTEIFLFANFFKPDWWLYFFFAWFVNKKKFVFSRFVSFSFCLHSYKHNIHTYTVGSLFGNHSLCVSVCLMFSVCVFLLRIVWNWLKNWIEKTEKIIFNNLSSMMMMAQQQQQRLYDHLPTR